jgi:hypothetical protein
MVARSTVLIISLTLLSACKGEEQARLADTVAAAPNVVSLSATEYAISAPDSIPAGWTTFRLANHGGDVHYGHIVRLDSGYTPQDLVGAYLDAIRKSAPRPAWVKRFGGPGGTAPGDSSNVTQQLGPGSYVWICPVEDSTGTPHFGKGEVKPFVVHAVAGDAAGRATAPTSDAAIRLADFTFTLESPLKAGRHTIRVENGGAEPHDISLMKLAPGRTIDELRNWLNPERARRSDDAKAPPPSIETIGTGGGGIAAIAPGMTAYFDADLTPGEYVLFCMVTAPDGRSHIEHGMMQQVRVE